MRSVAITLVAVSLPMLAGCRADPPSTAERILIDEAKRRIFVPNKAEKNPLPDSPKTIAAGRKAFAQYCVACHGLDAQNTGVPFAERMSPPVPSLASADVQQYTDGQLKWVIDYGIRPSGMPGAKNMLDDEDLVDRSVHSSPTTGGQPRRTRDVQPLILISTQ